MAIGNERLMNVLPSAAAAAAADTDRGKTSLGGSERSRASVHLRDGICGIT